MNQDDSITSWGVAFIGVCFAVFCVVLALAVGEPWYDLLLVFAGIVAGGAAAVGVVLGMILGATKMSDLQRRRQRTKPRPAPREDIIEVPADE